MKLPSTIFKIYIELPFFSVNTHIMCKALERCCYEYLCFDIRIYKWYFTLDFSESWENIMRRKKINKKNK